MCGVIMAKINDRRAYTKPSLRRIGRIGDVLRSDCSPAVKEACIKLEQELGPFAPVAKSRREKSQESMLVRRRID